MYNYRLVGCDTDSIKFCRPDGSDMTQEEMDEVLVSMNSIVPAGIVLEPDGYYENFLVIKSKNYVTKKKGKVEYKGSAVTDQKKEPALREMLEKMIVSLMEKNGTDLLDIYNQYCLEALSVKDISRWATKKTVTEAVFKSPRLNEKKVLDACNEAIEKEVIAGVQEGDKIWVYQAIKDGEKILRFTDLFDNDSQDHDAWHYVSRCWASVNILKNVIDVSQFPKYNLKKQQSTLLELAREKA